jgi:hypothetical protein
MSSGRQPWAPRCAPILAEILLVEHKGTAYRALMLPLPLGESRGEGLAARQKLPCQAYKLVRSFNFGAVAAVVNDG